MRTVHYYEPQDIDLNDLKNNPVNSFLAARIMILALRFSTGTAEAKDDPQLFMQTLIAEFLNHAQDAGITIAKHEDVPEAFKS